MTSRPALGRASLSLAVVFALVGCGSPPPQIATYQPDGGMDSIFTGTVSVTDTCVTLRDDSGVRWTPLFPIGQVSWSGDALHWAGVDYRNSDPIRLTGGAIDTETAASEITVSADQVTVPYGCPTARFWLVAPAP